MSRARHNLVMDLTSVCESVQEFTAADTQANAVQTEQSDAHVFERQTVKSLTCCSRRHRQWQATIPDVIMSWRKPQ